MQLGEFQLTTISGGRFQIDAGTMFGVVPKSLWERVCPADERNNIPQATNCALTQTGSQTVLIDTGYGSKLSDKERKIFRSEKGDPLLASLQAQGITAEEIDVVILSHLHFDHAGGATRMNDNSELVPTFPNAQYIAQKLEWETATSGAPELKGAYPLDNILPLKESGQLRLIEGDVEILPGISAVVTGGHTRGHMALKIESDGATALYLGDICPTVCHLRSLWCMAYDVDLLETRRCKPKLLAEIAEGGWLALFDHDPQHAAGRIVRDEKREFVVVDAMSVL